MKEPVHASPRSSARQLSLVAAMRLLALMLPFRFTGSMRIRIRVMCEGGQVVCGVTGAGAHLVAVEGNIHAPMRRFSTDQWARMAAAMCAASGHRLLIYRRCSSVVLPFVSPSLSMTANDLSR